MRTILLGDQWKLLAWRIVSCRDSALARGRAYGVPIPREWHLSRQGVVLAYETPELAEMSAADLGLVEQSTTLRERLSLPWNPTLYERMRETDRGKLASPKGSRMLLRDLVSKNLLAYWLPSECASHQRMLVINTSHLATSRVVVEAHTFSDTLAPDELVEV